MLWRRRRRVSPRWVLSPVPRQDLPGPAPLRGGCVAVGGERPLGALGLQRPRGNFMCWGRSRPPNPGFPADTESDTGATSSAGDSDLTSSKIVWDYLICSSTWSSRNEVVTITVICLTQKSKGYGGEGQALMWSGKGNKSADVWMFESTLEVVLPSSSYCTSKWRTWCWKPLQEEHDFKDYVLS